MWLTKGPGAEGAEGAGGSCSGNQAAFSSSECRAPRRPFRPQLTWGWLSEQAPSGPACHHLQPHAHLSQAQVQGAGTDTTCHSQTPSPVGLRQHSELCLPLSWGLVPPLPWGAQGRGSHLSAPMGLRALRK